MITTRREKAALGSDHPAGLPSIPHPATPQPSSVRALSTTHPGREKHLLPTSPRCSGQAPPGRHASMSRGHLPRPPSFPRNSNIPAGPQSRDSVSTRGSLPLSVTQFLQSKGNNSLNTAQEATQEQRQEGTRQSTKSDTCQTGPAAFGRPECQPFLSCWGPPCGLAGICSFRSQMGEADRLEKGGKGWRWRRQAQPVQSRSTWPPALMSPQRPKGGLPRQTHSFYLGAPDGAQRPLDRLLVRASHGEGPSPAHMGLGGSRDQADSHGRSQKDTG